MKPQYRQHLGKRGEDIATEYLGKKGYRIIQRNFRARPGEIDIVCSQGSTVVFVEVKTRHSMRYGTPLEAVTPRKIHELVNTAAYYLLTHNMESVDWRIDVVGILLGNQGVCKNITHIRNVTG